MPELPDHHQPCTLVGVSMEDPAAAVRDPKLTALIAAGWQVVAHVPAQRGGRTEWLLLLQPPRPTQNTHGNRWQLVLLVLLVLLQCLQVLAALTGA